MLIICTVFIVALWSWLSRLEYSFYLTPIIRDLSHCAIFSSPEWSNILNRSARLFFLVEIDISLFFLCKLVGHFQFKLLIIIIFKNKITITLKIKLIFLRLEIIKKRTTYRFLIKIFVHILIKVTNLIWITWDDKKISEISLIIFFDTLRNKICYYDN